MTEDLVVAPCSLLLEVFEPVSIYEEDAETVAWEVSSDPDHPTPYLLAPRNYAEQEIDPVRCTASIGTVEIGVIDPPTIPGDQTSGWMTARVHDVKGRRCRLRRFISDEIGWVTIADGPASNPRMDASYAAYRWTIRDTRETERKLISFNQGGVTAIVPRGPIYGWGNYEDEDGAHVLLPAKLTTPVVGTFEVSAVDDLTMGVVNFASHYTPGVDLDPPTLDDANLIIDEAGQKAIELTEVLTDLWGAKNADVIWRKVGDPDWNISRYIAPTTFRQPFAGTTESLLDGEGDIVISLDYVTLFLDTGIPDGFPLAGGDSIELIIRYRGPASEEFPYYVEGPLGEVLANLYTGVYAVAPTTGIDGFLYDPAGLDTSDLNLTAVIQYDPEAFDVMVDHVLLRQTAPVEDTRSWTETNLYAPSGWIPALDNDMRISPVSRNRPSAIDNTLMLDDAVTVPAPNWTTGERTVSQIIYTYPRYFLPTEDSNFEVGVDGLATREVSVSFEDLDSEVRYGPVVESFDASAFAAIGTEEGINIPGQLETANVLCQTAKFEVLDRYRSGVQSISVSVRRSRIPNVRAGDWVPWQLVWLPDRTTGLRGSVVNGAQIVSLRDDDCTWRTVVLEEAELSSGAPGFVTLLEKVGDAPGAGLAGLRVLSDEESY